MKLRRSVAVTVVTVVTGIAVSLAAAPAQAGGPTTRVEWGACPEEVAVVSPTLQCARVPVPLDYRDPDGVTIDIAVSRIASAKPAQRRGILLLNPGGPGASGLTMPADLVGLGLPSSVSERYDLIGMDPRGVGRSAPVSCGFTGELDYFSNVPPYAVDDAAVIERARTAQAAAEWCAANDTEGRLRHITTANTARDLDAIRAALGEATASFYGASYGSALGAAYASMFPDTTDRVVVDSNLGDTHLDRAAMRRFGLGVEQTFPDFAAWAAVRHGAYGLGRTPAQVRRTYFRLAERLDEAPVGAVNGAVFRFTTFVALYGKVNYPALAQEWQTLLRSDEAAVTGPGDRAATPPEVLPWDNFLSAFLAVTCNDVNWPEDVATYRRAVAEDRKRYPMYGAASANITPCAYWAHEPSEPPVGINDRGPRNVLIVQNLRDPGTPHRGGVLLREKFAKRSRLVSVDGSGHGVYVYGDNACALNLTTAYLVDGTMPKDTRCGPTARRLDADAAQRRADTLDQLHRRNAATFDGNAIKESALPATLGKMLPPAVVRQVLSVMATCGMYDAAGDWATQVGIPAKSGVAGGLIGALPGQLGIATFSPRLDRHGNSVRGVSLFERFSADMGLHVMEVPPAARAVVRSNRVRGDGADATRIVRLQGGIRFVGAERIVREVVESAPSEPRVVLDVSLVHSIDDVSRRMLLEVARRLSLDGHEVYLVDPEMMIPDPDPGDGVRLAVIDVIDHLRPGRTS